MIETFINIAKAFPWEETRPGALGSDVIVRREPVGVVAAIPPWNVPQFTTISKIAPALLAGCTVVLKPAPETPARLLPDGRAAPGGRRARRRGQHRRGRSRGGGAPRRAPRRRQGRVHRLDRRRPQDRRGVRRAAQARQPRARREVGRDRARRRRPGRDHGGSAVHRADEQRPGAASRRPASWPAARSTPRWWTPSPRRSAPCRSATPPTRRPRSARWWRVASRSGWRSTSRSARRRAPASWSAATGCPTGSTAAGTCDPPCSRTWTTRCGSRRRRSSARCSR